MDDSIKEVLKVIAEYSGRATWYPLARKTKHNIRGLLRQLEIDGLITSTEGYLADKCRTEIFYSITDAGLVAISNQKGETKLN